jgi:uncharacterized protein YdaU (DUF1376 family)
VQNFGSVQDVLTRHQRIDELVRGMLHQRASALTAKGSRGSASRTGRHHAVMRSCGDA